MFLAAGALTMACSDEPPEVADARRRAPEPASDSLATSPSESARGAYFRARMDQTLSGPSPDTHVAYQRVLDAYDIDPVLAARAALELAELAAAQRRRRVALELIARASSLGASDRELIDRASQLRRRLAAVSAQDIEVRGPRAGTPLGAVSAAAAERFARGEELLAVYLRRRPSARLEEVTSSVRSKRASLETAVRAYRAVIELDEPVATTAAEFRVASMYYDLSLTLTSDLTREMLPSAAAKFRASLRSMARSNRRSARDAYRRALEAARNAGDGASRWREAAELGLTSVEDLLR